MRVKEKNKKKSKDWDSRVKIVDAKGKSFYTSRNQKNNAGKISMPTWRARREKKIEMTTVERLTTKDFFYN